MIQREHKFNLTIITEGKFTLYIPILGNNEGNFFPIVQLVTGIFTDSAFWAVSVMKSPCPSVCMSQQYL